MRKKKSVFLRLSLYALLTLFVITCDEVVTNHVEDRCIISTALDLLGDRDESTNHIIRVVNRDIHNEGIKAEYKTYNTYTDELHPLKAITDKSGKILYYKAPRGSTIDGFNYTQTILTTESYIEVTKNNEIIKQIKR